MDPTAQIILDGIDLAVRLIGKLQETWTAQGLAPDAFDAAVAAATKRLQDQAALDAATETAGRG